MEFVFKPLNHLIAIGLRLDRKTLHIKASFLEWMVILLLNWLHMLYGVCSTIIKGERKLMEPSR